MLSGLLVLLPPIIIAIAIGLAFALRVTCRRRTSESWTGESRAAGDPFFYPIGECPTTPADMAVSFYEATVPNYRRHLDASDFRAWGLPPSKPSSAGALRRIEDDGRPAMPRSGTAVVLTFRGRGA